VRRAEAGFVVGILVGPKADATGTVADVFICPMELRGSA
jgi:hypothetical protein